MTAADARTAATPPVTRDLLALGRGACLPDRCDVPVHVKVVDIASKAGEQPAVTSRGRTISYAELDRLTAALAGRLLARGVRRGDRIGILVDPSIQMVVAVLAALRSGASYVPLDHAQPDMRIQAVVADAGLQIIIVDEQGEARCATLSLVTQRVLVDAKLTVDELGPVPVVMVEPEDAAYIIYTSGSTGMPKGVLVRHRELAASTQARALVYPGAPVFLLVSPLAFDSSVAGLWGALCTGGHLVIATAEEVRDPEVLARQVGAYGVTHLLCVPSLYASLLDVAEARGLTAELVSLRSVIVAGEPLPEELLKRHFSILNETEIVNEYGPTEATVWASFRRFTGPASVTIGNAIPGARLYVLNEEGGLAADGELGELHVGGAGVSAGYFGQPDETAAAFLPDRFAPEAGARMYRTGDLVRWTASGELEFHGRKDHQVKVRGFRIELLAVETVLRGAPGVLDAIAVADLQRGRLVAYVRAQTSASTDAIRRHAAAHLPAVAVPGVISLRAAFPFTFAGKVDRLALAAEAALEPDEVVAPNMVAPDLAGGIANAWREVLQRADVATDVNFFDLGGHSLMMFKLQDAIERQTGARPALMDLFQHTTITTQAELLRGELTGSASSEGQASARSLRARALESRRRRAERELTSR